jgi:hypothetical protein
VTTPKPLANALRLDPGDPQVRQLADLFTCVRCHHDLSDHGPAGSVPPSKSKCQLDGCGCARFMREGDSY